MSMYFPKRLELSFRIVLAFPKAEGRRMMPMTGAEKRKFTFTGILWEGFSEEVAKPRLEGWVGLHWTAVAAEGLLRGRQSAAKGSEVRKHGVCFQGGKFGWTIGYRRKAVEDGWNR